MCCLLTWVHTVATATPRNSAWRVAVERPDSDREARLPLDLVQGGLAVSGDSHRYLFRDGAISATHCRRRGCLTWAYADFRSVWQLALLRILG